MLMGGSKDIQNQSFSSQISQQNYQSIDLKPQGVKSIGNLGHGFVGLAANSDFVKDVGINKVFTFENEKKQYHMDQALKNKEQNLELRQEYQKLMKDRKSLEDQSNMKHVKDQHLHYDNMNKERQRFLKKITTLNETITTNQKQGAYDKIYTLQQRQKDEAMRLQKERESQIINEANNIHDSMRGQSKQKIAKQVLADQMHQFESRKKAREFELTNETRKDLNEARKIKEIYDQENN